MNKDLVMVLVVVLTSMQAVHIMNMWRIYKAEKFKKELIARWEETYLKYMETADELRKGVTNGSAHNLARFDAKAMTIRDCIKDLKNKTT
jgi:hypothetical protein